MKKLLLLLLFPIFLHSQNPQQRKIISDKSNQTALAKISEQYRAYFYANKNRALDLAKFYNWPTEINTKDSYSQLIGVRENQPIYYMTYNLGAGVTSRANKLYAGGGLNINIHGENMLSGVWDAGAAMPTHQLFTGRVQVMDDTPQSHYHSTHVAGTIMGSDEFQTGSAKGMAFMANAHSYDWNDDLAEIATAASNGLLLSNHSYGYNPSFLQLYQWGKYDLDSQAVDQVMFNAPYYQFVCAAGNSRNDYNLEKNGYDLITGHAVSKNSITVAAVHEVQNYTGANSVVMSEFSSWGPTDDGRIKPDISAKGVSTFSALDDSQTSYGSLSGTSMASPSVNGTLLLVQQYYNSLTQSFLQAATLRALMIHTADEAGDTPGPDYKFGWGLINAEECVDVITKKEIRSHIMENTLAQGESFSIAVEAEGTEPLIATLCWTDPQGIIPPQTVDLNTPNLINDLDIRITQADETYYPWKLSAAAPSNAATKADNIVDNVEKNAIENPAGTYTITVSHKGILQNALQNYSLIISGITVNDFWFTANEHAQSICTGTDSAEFQFNLNTKVNFEETVTLSALNLPPGITATFNPPIMTADGNFDLTLSNLNSLPLGNYSFVVKGESASETFEMEITFHILSPEFADNALLLPLNNAIDLDNPISFSWVADPNAESYDIQIADDINFTNIVESATVTENSYISASLESNTVYFWRIKSKNACASGNYSEAFTFTTICVAPSQIEITHAGSFNASISWTDSSSASSWLLEIVPQGVTPTGVGIPTNSNPHTFTGLTPDTCYDVYLFVSCISGTSEWLGPISFCTQKQYCNGEHFYDTGGPAGNYQNNENSITTIYPEENGERIRAIINAFNAGSCCDNLVIRNGPDATSPILFSSMWGNPTGAFVSTHDSGALTFEFQSDSSLTYSGWDITIICEIPPACPYPPSNVFLLNATTTTATIGWYDFTEPISWETEVVLQGTTPSGIGTSATSNPLLITGLVKNTCYDFYVRGICLNGASDWIGPLTFCTTPDYCNGDHFYDSGGVDGDYQISEYKSTIIYPESAGQRIRAVFNSFDLGTGCCDQLEIYNGPNSSGQLLFIGNATNIPGSIASTHDSGALAFYFYSDGFQAAPGWDATIICEPMPPCQHPPTLLVASNITKTSATLSWSENSNAVSWQVEVVLQGATPTGIGSAITINPYQIEGLITDTCYDVYLKSICLDGPSDWVGPYSICTQPDYCAGSHFYDTGGATGSYQDNEFYTNVIYPDNAGDRIRAIFNSLELESCCDSFRIYNGPDTTHPLLFQSSWNNMPGTVSSTHPSGALTFLFDSDGSVTASGWDATIICEFLPPCATPPSNIEATNLTKTTALINWTENSNATSWMVDIVIEGATPTGVGIPAATNLLPLTGLSINTCYDVYVRSICSDGPSDWTGPYTFCTLPDYCNGDHFYDSGGPTGSYQNSEFSTTVIVPDITGERVRAIFNSFQLENCCDYLRIYNGPDNTYPLLFQGNGSNSPGTVASTDPSGALTFQFYSDGSGTYSGWDATIICEPLPPCANAPTNLHLVNVNTGSASVAWIENSDATSWEIELTAENATPTGVGIITNINSYTFLGLQNGTCYKVYVRAICSMGPSDWIGPLDFCTQPDYCAGAHFYDSGGPGGNYDDGEDYTTVIFPDTTGERVRAIFNSFQLEGCCDYLRIYNGPNSSYPLLFVGNGTTSPGTVTSTDPSGALTFSFHSDGSVVYSGWDAVILCDPAPPCPIAPQNLVISNILEDAAAVTWTQDSDATQWDIAIVAQDSAPVNPTATTDTNVYQFTNLIPNTCYDVYVRALCAAGTSDWSGPAQFCTTPDYCGGNHFYDSGGPTAPYQNGEFITTVIYPEEVGIPVNVVFNSFQLEGCCDYLRIYNGSDTTYPLISSHNGTNSPGSITSTATSGALTFVFTSDGSATFSGWDATVNCQNLGLDNINTGFNVLEYYPNPVTNVININAHETVSNFVVYNIEGRRIKTGTPNMMKFEIDFSDLPSGTYLIKLADPQNKERKIKILKK